MGCGACDEQRHESRDGQTDSTAPSPEPCSLGVQPTETEGWELPPHAGRKGGRSGQETAPSLWGEARRQCRLVLPTELVETLSAKYLPPPALAH